MNFQPCRCFLPALLVLGGLLPGAVAADDLVFPENAAEPSARTFRLVPERVVDRHIAGKVEPERLADTLLALLPLESRSCREQDITAAARALFEEIGAAAGMRTAIDDLPRQVAAMPPELQQEYACDNGRTLPQSGNLIAVLLGNPNLPAWNLSFHLDTNQVLFEGFERDGDRIRPPPGSPLGADDKAGIAIIAEVLRVIIGSGIEHGDIRVVGLVAEEDSAAGAMLVAGDAFRGDIVVSVDGGDPHEIGRAAPTSYSGHMTVRTQPSHPADVHDRKSVSACAVGTHILHEAGFGPAGHPPGNTDVVLHSYFMSCGVDGGSLTPKGEPLADYQYNVIAPYWTAAWQLRSLEGPDAAREMAVRVRSVMDRVCAEAAQGRTPVECLMTGTERPSLTGYTVPADAPSVRLLATGFRGTDDGSVKITARQFGGFNGNYIKERFGQEMLIVGTGADQTHTNEETVSVRGMARVARGLLAAILESYRYERVRD
jgi:di/tripeptidase